MSHWLKRSLIVMPLLFGVTKPAIAVTNVEISPAPLAGVSQAFPANVYLALSVEFPTAGAAYNTQQQDGSTWRNILNTDANLKTEYLGYFDPKKCYLFENNRFNPVAWSTTDSSGRLGLCNNNGATNQYSGNVLNWATMTALDIYRSTMTGGNRALGIETTATAYSNGDQSNFTTLRRAKVVSGQNESYRLTDRRVKYRKDILQKLFPHTLIRSGAGNSDVLTITFNNKVFNAEIVYQNNNNQSQTLTLPVVVEVCKSGLLESNCTKYGSNYKPEGLMQRNVDKMNFSSLGYLNISGGSTNRSGGHQVSGGVVRSQLGSIRGEFSASTGQYVVNPYPQTGVNNSGSINYLNKFGDANGYKTNDPVAELYYTALRYIRGMGYVNSNNWMPTNLTTAEKDDFPVVDINNKDPFKNSNGQWDIQKVCSKNTIMLIGDTNSHADGNLPNLDDNNGFRPNDDTVDTQDYINKLKAAELQYIGAPANSAFMNTYLDKNGNTGSSRSPGGLPALAYWANTQNVRPDVPRKVTVQTFAIDVLENTDYKTRTDNGHNWIRNAYYLAGKYGSFEDKNGDGVPSRSDPSEWTNDPVVNNQVQSSISQFTYGKPKGYALANSPSSMVAALEQAFNESAAAPDVSQTGVTTSSTVDLVDVENDLIIRSAYSDRSWSGDVIAFKLNTSENAWRANDLLKTNTNRKIFAHDGTAVRDFTAANAASFSNALSGNVAVTPQNLIEYVRGNTALEGSAGLRPRLGNKLGTVVNSQVVSIRPPLAAPRGCEYANSNVRTRTQMYGVASNDGMYHVFDNNGNERFAYIPSTAVSKLNAYADPAYTHQFINDGSSMVAEVCFADVARSVVVGSTGRGGRAVYALDVTDLSNPSAANVLWEFSNANDSDFGHFIGEPIITKDVNGNPIAIVSSGYNSNSNNGYLYILQINKTGAWAEGVNYQKVALGEAGVGAPFGYDQDNNGVVDAIYVGDLSGKLWKVNAPQATAGWAVAFNGQPLFQAPAGAYITAAPYVQVTRGRLTVFIGTGRYFSNNDFNSSVQNYAYGVFDTGVPITNPATQILEQTIAPEDDSVAGFEGRLWMLSSNAIESQHLGWRITLRPGQMIVDQAHVQSKRVAFFNVFTPMPESNCLETSQTFLLGADVRSGSNYDEPLFDTNNDGIVDNRDGVGGFYKLGDMLGPVGTMLQTTDGRLLYVVIGSDGKVYQLDLNALAIPPSNLKYKRLSWREIF